MTLFIIAAVITFLLWAPLRHGVQIISLKSTCPSTAPDQAATTETAANPTRPSSTETQHRAPLSRETSPSAAGTKNPSENRRSCGCRIIVAAQFGSGFVLLIVTIAGLIYSNHWIWKDFWIAAQYEFLFENILTGPTLAQLLLGGIAGVILRAFLRKRLPYQVSEPITRSIQQTTANVPVDPQEPTGARHETRAATEIDAARFSQLRKPPVTLLVTLFALSLGAVIAPSLPGLTGRLVGIKTSFRELQLSTPRSDDQLLIDIQRDLITAERLDYLTTEGRYIKLDCYVDALKKGGVSKLLSENDFLSAQRFNASVWYLFYQTQRSIREGYDADELRRALSPVGDALFQILLEINTAHVQTEQGFDIKKMEKLVDIFARRVRARRAELASNDPSHFESITRKYLYGIYGPDETSKPPECGLTNPPNNKWSVDKDARQISKATMEVIAKIASKKNGASPAVMYLYMIAGDLLLFTGNIDGAIRVLHWGHDYFADDVNMNSELGQALYLGDHPFSEVFPGFDKAIEGVESWKNLVKSSLVGGQGSESDKEVHRVIEARVKRAALTTRMRLAYLCAQANGRWPTAVA